MRYFKKALVTGNPLYLANGRKAPFEEMGGDNGFLATEDGWTIGQLEQAARKGVGGVVELTAEQFEDEKKNSLAWKSQGGSGLGRLRQLRSRLVANPAVAPESAPPLPINPHKGGVGKLNPSVMKSSVVRSVGAIKVVT